MEGGDRIDLYYFGVGKMVGWCTKVRFEIYLKSEKKGCVPYLHFILSAFPQGKIFTLLTQQLRTISICLRALPHSPECVECGRLAQLFIKRCLYRFINAKLW